MKIAIAVTAFGLFTLATACHHQSSTPAPAPTAAKEASATAAKDAGKDATKEKSDCASCPDAMAQTEGPGKTDNLAKGITLKDYTPISKILAAPASFEGKRVLVKGEAVAVCEKRGCWVTLKSDADNSKSLRVKVEDGEIVFPLTVKGDQVEAEGIVQKVVTPEADYREALRKRAEAKGETFDPKSVTGPLVTWQLRGLGARFKS